MNPGKLDKRIKILSFDDNDVEDSDVDDEAGGSLDNWSAEEGWTDVLETWASVKPASEKAIIIADQKQLIVSHSVLVRYNKLIKQSHVINYKNRRLDIQTIKNLNENDKYLLLMCDEKVQSRFALKA